MGQKSHRSGATTGRIVGQRDFLPRAGSRLQLRPLLAPTAGTGPGTQDPAVLLARHSKHARDTSAIAGWAAETLGLAFRYREVCHLPEPACHRLSVGEGTAPRPPTGVVAPSV